MPKTICILGAFDTKGEDHAFLREQILAHGHQVLTLNIGGLGTTRLFPVDFEASEVIGAVDPDLEQMRSRKDKAEAMKAFAERVPKFVRDLYDHGRFYRIISLRP